MMELLLAVIAAELGLIVTVIFGILGLEFYAMYLRSKQAAEEAKMFKVSLSPEELSSMIGGGVKTNKPNIPMTEEQIKDLGKLYL